MYVPHKCGLVSSCLCKWGQLYTVCTQTLPYMWLLCKERAFHVCCKGVVYNQFAWPLCVASLHGLLFRWVICRFLGCFQLIPADPSLKLLVLCVNLGKHFRLNSLYVTFKV